jgi:hypothetical protein
VTLETHNFFCKPPIEVRSEAKVFNFSIVNLVVESHLVVAHS